MTLNLIKVIKGNIQETGIFRLTATEKESCVLCGRATPVDYNTPISDRIYYVEGAGQLHPECYRSVYPEEGQAGDSSLLYELVEILPGNPLKRFFRQRRFRDLLGWFFEEL